MLNTVQVEGLHCAVKKQGLANEVLTLLLAILCVVKGKHARDGAVAARSETYFPVTLNVGTLAEPNVGRLLRKFLMFAISCASVPRGCMMHALSAKSSSALPTHMVMASVTPT